MSLVYRLMYLVGFTPWDTGAVPPELIEVVEGRDALPAGRALDIGCGTGAQAVYLAGHGWQVTGIDAVGQPLRKARARASQSGVSVEWIQAGVAQLPEIGLTPGFNLIHDRGCFHGLNSKERAVYAAAASDLAAPGSILLMMAFARNDVPVGPAGADQAEIAEAFAQWDLVASSPDSGPDPAGPLGKVPRRWYRLIRRG